MKRLQLHRLKYWLSQKWSRFSAIKFWLQDVKYAHERCQWCGWYLNPQLLFKGINRPQKLTYYREPNGDWVCAKCRSIKNI